VSGARVPLPLQDTNALVFRGLVAALGVSARHDYDMNSLAVPRKAQEVSVHHLCMYMCMCIISACACVTLISV
jgi:hypothetical protein